MAGLGFRLKSRLPLGYRRGFAFSKDGFFYCQETDQQNGSEHRICHQVLGSPEKTSVSFRAVRTPGSRLTPISGARWLGAVWAQGVGEDSVTSMWVANLDDGASDWIEVVRDRHGPWIPILFQDRILMRVETASGNTELIEISKTGEKTGLLVPEKTIPIHQIAVTENHILVSYQESGFTTIDAWSSTGEPAGSIALPDGATIRMLPFFGAESSRIFLTVESFDASPAIYEHHVAENRFELWHQQGPAEPGCIGTKLVASSGESEISASKISRNWQRRFRFVPDNSSNRFLKRDCGRTSFGIGSVTCLLHLPFSSKL